MDDKDIKAYHKMIDKLEKQANVKGLKKSNKYNYIQGKQITDHGTGKRVYEINNYRLPSVTTILGATKNQDFIKQWKAKVGEQEADRIKKVLSDKDTFDKLQQEQRDLDESYKQSLKNKREREENEEYLKEIKDKL